MNVPQISQDTLLAIYTWATVALAVIATAAAAWGYFQLRALRTAKAWQEAQAIMAEIRSPERIALLNALYGTAREPEKLALIEADTRILVSRMEWVAIMVRRKQMGLGLVMDLMPATPSRIWYILGSYIENQEQHRGTYGPNFRQLVQETIVYFVANTPRPTWPKLGPPACLEDVDLVPYLAQDMGILSSSRFIRVILLRRFKSIFDKELRMTKQQWRELTRPAALPSLRRSDEASGDSEASQPEEPRDDD